MSTNSNPVDGTGTATADADDGFDAFLAESGDRTNGEKDEREETEPGDDGEPLEAADADDADAEEGDGEGEEGQPTDVADDVIVKLADGTQVTVKELREGYQRTADYTRKTQALAEENRKIEATQARIAEQARATEQHKQNLEKTFDDVIAIMSQFLPPEPDANMAFTDPQGFMQQRALYDARVREIQQVMQAQEASRGQTAKAEAEQAQAMAAAEARKIEAAYPEIRGNPAKAREFLASAYAQAETLGISATEMNTVTDARLLIGLAKLARYEAREKARTAKPPVPAQQERRPNPGAPRVPVQGGNPQAAKSIQNFRKSQSASAARSALDSGAFDNFLS